MLLLLPLLLLAGGIASCAHGPKDAVESAPILLQARPIDLETYHLFDLGATDIDADGALDVYTVNHSARQSFLPGDGAGGFGANALVAWGLNQSAMFPGLEDAADGPAFTRPGLYIFWRSSRLVFHAHQLAAGGPIDGEAAFFTPVQVQHDPGFLVSQQQMAVTPEIEGVRLSFSAAGDGEMIVTPQPFPRVGSPISLTLAAGVPLEQVFVGALAVSPPQRTFTLMLQDRHGLVWNDFDENGRRDLFIAGGAVRGLSGALEMATRPYELFYHQDDGFRRVATPPLGFEKGACPARQTGLVDFDGDGLLDVYVVCIRDAPNQLYRRLPSGGFANVAREAGLDIPEGGFFAWLDVENDGDMDMLWAGEKGVRLYVNQRGAFTAHPLPGPAVRAQKIALGDFDGDGDGDAFIASPQGNALYRNDDGDFAYVEPKALGLPAKALTANWLDFDNDGLLDLHTLPRGLYLQEADHRFRRAPMQDDGLAADSDAKAARAIWFDADNDGFRDVIAATAQQDKHWRASYGRNPGNGNHWLEVILHGPPGNRPAIGARVSIVAGGAQTASVGWAEGSHYGMGQYRLYFGLGPEPRVASLTVAWPDGSQTRLADVAADQVLELSWRK